MPAQYPTESTSDPLPMGFLWPQAQAHGAYQKCWRMTPPRGAAIPSLLARVWCISAPASPLLSQYNSGACGLGTLSPKVPRRVKFQLFTVVPNFTINAVLAYPTYLFSFPPLTYLCFLGAPPKSATCLWILVLGAVLGGLQTKLSRGNYGLVNSSTSIFSMPTI